MVVFGVTVAAFQIVDSYMAAEIDAIQEPTSLDVEFWEKRTAMLEDVRVLLVAARESIADKDDPLPMLREAARRLRDAVAGLPMPEHVLQSLEATSEALARAIQ
jgi:hypothetical protein